MGLHVLIIAREIVGEQEQENAIASLFADGLDLLRSIGFGEQEICGAGVGGTYEKPALRGGERRVFDHAEAECLGEEGESLVVIANEQRDMRDGLRHCVEIIPRLRRGKQNASSRV